LQALELLLDLELFAIIHLHIVVSVGGSLDESLIADFGHTSNQMTDSNSSKLT